MRHPVRDRLVMLVYALASFAAAALLIAVMIGRVTAEKFSAAAAVFTALPHRTAMMMMLAGVVILVLMGVALLYAMLPPKKKRSSTFAIQHNENGTVRISLKTIDALVSKCLNQHSELKVVTSSLFSDEETVRIDVHIALLTDISMPLAISALQKQITRYVEACSGVNVKEVRVFVDAAMPGEEKAQQSQYALPSSVLGSEEEMTEEEAPAAEEVTAVEETPVVEEAPAVEETPVVEEAPAVEETPVVEEAPAAEEAPVAEEAAAVEEAVEQEETAQAPVKKKGFFGLFGRK